MKKTPLFILTLLFIYVQLQAQKNYSNKEFNVRFGYPYEIPKGYNDLGYFGSVETGFVQLSYKIKKDLFVQVFDKNLKVVKENNVDITMFPRDFTNEGFYQMGNKYYWFFSTFEKKEEKESFWVQEIDITSGKLIGKVRELIQNNRLEGDLNSIGFYQYEISNKYRIEFSYDKSKMLITYILKHKEKKDRLSKEEIGFSVFDEDLSVISNKVIPMPYSEEKMDNEDYDVDSKGNAYLLAKVYNDKRKEKKDDLPNYYFEVFRLKAGTAELNQIQVKLQTYFISDLFITEQSNKEIMVGGFYSKEANSGSSDGVFLAKIDEEGNATNFGKGYYEFPLDVLKQFMSARQQRKLERKNDKEDVEAKNLVLRKIISGSDGSIQLIGEVSYITVHTYSNGKTSYTVTTYYYEDILTMKILANGEIAWAKKIPKMQQGSNGRGSMSFSYYANGDDTYLFYTDNIKNLHLAIDKEPAYHQDTRGGYLVYSKIDKNGTVTKGDLFDYDEEKIRFEPAEFQSLGNNTMANRAFKGRMSRVVILNQK